MISRSQGAGTRNRFRDNGSRADHPIFRDILVKKHVHAIVIVAACVATDQLEVMSSSDTSA
jgi:hypothetical protein